MTTPTPSELEDLAARCESATGPDREIDMMIHARDGLEGVGHWQDAPAFTASLDAAMTLVPERDASLWWGVRHGKLLATVEMDNEIASVAATPALALVAAALRAIAKERG